MSANDLSKPESLDNLSQPSSQEGQQRKQYKVHRLGNRKQSSNQNYYIKEQASSREERKLKSYLQRIEEQQKLEEAALLKRKRSKPNQETKSSETQEGPKQIDEVMYIQEVFRINKQIDKGPYHKYNMKYANIGHSVAESFVGAVVVSIRCDSLNEATSKSQAQDERETSHIPLPLRVV